MALAGSRNLNNLAGHDGGKGQLVYPTSIDGAWFLACENIEGTTAQTAAQLRRPLALTATNSYAIDLTPGVTRVLLRARVPVAAGAVTTSPAVWVYGMDTRYEDGWVEGTTDFMRLDNTGGVGGSTSIVCDTTANTGDFRDSVYFYSAVTSLAGLDVLGVKSVLVIQATQSAIASITTGVDVMLRQLN